MMEVDTSQYHIAHHTTSMIFWHVEIARMTCRNMNVDTLAHTSFKLYGIQALITWCVIHLKKSSTLAFSILYNAYNQGFLTLWRQKCMWLCCFRNFYNHDSAIHLIQYVLKLWWNLDFGGGLIARMKKGFN